MHIHIFLLGMLVTTYFMVMAKRLPALINSFRWQSLFLFLITISLAIKEKDFALYIVAGLIFILKIILVPYFLLRVARKIKVNENLGFFMNPQLSLLSVLLLTYLTYLFTFKVMLLADKMQSIFFGLSLCVTLIGLFIMIFRMKALVQIIGLLVMENGLFLAAVTLCGGMPFIVELATFLDVFISVIILGVFVYRINALFTHIDVNKLDSLRG